MRSDEILKAELFVSAKGDADSESSSLRLGTVVKDRLLPHRGGNHFEGSLTDQSFSWVEGIAER